MSDKIYEFYYVWWGGYTNITNKRYQSIISLLLIFLNLKEVNLSGSVHIKENLIAEVNKALDFVHMGDKIW